MALAQKVIEWSPAVKGVGEPPDITVKQYNKRQLQFGLIL